MHGQQNIKKWVVGDSMEFKRQTYKLQARRYTAATPVTAA